MTNQTITASPLTWPTGWKRTDTHDRARARFNKKKWSGYGTRQLTINDAREALEGEMWRLGVEGEFILSTDLQLRLDGFPRSGQREPEDPGASVWWRPPGADQDRVIAIDIYDRVADNIYAIAKTIEAMRGIKRWGGGEVLERTFTGLTALPSPETAGGVDPYQVIGIDRGASDVEIRRAFNKARSKAHPDHGGSTERFNQVIEAGRQLGL